MGVLGARKLEQTTAASESHSDYLLSKRDNVPLPSVFGSGRGKPEKEGKKERVRERGGKERRRKNIT